MSQIDNVLATLSYVKQFSGTTVLIKLGGSCLQDPARVQSICEDLIKMRSVGIQVVIVHGGGPAINQELERRGVSWSFFEGQRVTTPEMMSTIEMVLSGNVNRSIVKLLNASGIRAVGISGVDALTLLCKKASEQLGQVGTIEQVNTQLIQAILQMPETTGVKVIPVIASVGTGFDGQTYNINADWAASRIASALGITKLIFLTDQDGILNKDSKLIPELDAGELEALIESGVVRDGMLAKVNTILHALNNGVTDIHILNANKPHALIEEVFTNGGIGTVCRLRSRSGFAHLEGAHV